MQPSSGPREIRLAIPSLYPENAILESMKYNISLTLMVAQEEEWQIYASKKEIPEMPELPFKIPGVWAEDKPLD
jgi:hypothetical protein